MSDLILDVGLANELKLAFRRAGYQPEDIKKFSEGDWAAKILTVLRGQATVVHAKRFWYEEDGIIYLSVTSDGTTGPKWFDRLNEQDISVGNDAKTVLFSHNVRYTSGTTMQIAVLKGMLFHDNDRVTDYIRTEASRRGFSTPNVEVACLIREKVSDDDLRAMGLYLIAVMHDPMNDSDINSLLLSADRGCWLYTCRGRPDGQWLRDSGFAFVVSHAP
jgi:hypothetical protein